MSWMNVKLRPPSKPTLAQASQNPTVNLRPVSKVETEIPGAQAFGAVLRPVSKNKTEKSGNEVEDVGLLSPPRFQQSASGEFSTESEDDLELTLKSRNVSSDGETSLEGNAARKLKEGSTAEGKDQSQQKQTKPRAVKPFFVGGNTYNIVVKKGQVIQLDYKYGGTPDPVCTWTLDGTPLEPIANKISILTQGKSTLIKVFEAARSDTGKYKLTLTNSAGSCESTGDVVVLDKPLAPKGPLRAKIVKGNKVRLNWKRAEDFRTSGIKHYLVEKMNLETGAWEAAGICSPDEEGIQLEGLIPKKKYKFRVKAVNDEGESDPLEIDEPIMSSTDESDAALWPPEKLRIVYRQGKLLKLEWDSNPESSTENLLEYVVHMRKVNTNTWEEATRVPATFLQAEISSLDGSTEYEFHVSGVNENGKSEPSEVVTTAGRAPLRPENLRVVRQGKNIKLEWEENPENENLMSQYIVQMKKGDNETWKDVAVVPGTTLQTEVNSVDEKAEYNLRILGINENGKSDPSDVVTAGPLPFRPRKPRIVDRRDNNVKLEWNDDTESDAKNLSKYIVQMKKVNVTTWEDALTVPGTSFEALIKSVDGTCEYDFRIIGVNVSGDFSKPMQQEMGKSDPSEPVTTVSLPEDCHAPCIDRSSLENPVVIQTGEALALKANFNADANPECYWMFNGHPIETGDMKIKTGTSSTELVVTRSDKIHSGIYTLTTMNDLGKDVVTFEVKVRGKPSHPKGLSILKKHSEGCKLVWRPPEDDGGSCNPLTYEVSMLDTSVGEITALGKTQDLEMEVKGLSPMRSYHFSVVAQNEFGESDPIITEPEVILSNDSNSSEKPMKPVFKRELQDTSASRGKQAIFVCEAESGERSTSKHQWFKDGKAIQFNDRVWEENTGSRYRLIISNLQNEDNGTYTCQVTNGSTSNATSARLQVQGLRRNVLDNKKPVEDPFGLLVPRILPYKPKERCRKRNTFEGKAEVWTRDSIPSFTFHLRPRIIQLNEPCKLICCLSGYPKPMIKWYHDSYELRSTDYEMSHSDGVVTLEMLVCKPEDTGLYRCVATNLHGKAETSCEVTVGVQEMQHYKPVY